MCFSAWYWLNCCSGIDDGNCHPGTDIGLWVAALTYSYFNYSFKILWFLRKSALLNEVSLPAALFYSGLRPFLRVSMKNDHSHWSVAPRNLYWIATYLTGRMAVLFSFYRYFPPLQLFVKLTMIAIFTIHMQSPSNEGQIARGLLAGSRYQETPGQTAISSIAG